MTRSVLCAADPICSPPDVRQNRTQRAVRSHLNVLIGKGLGRVSGGPQGETIPAMDEYDKISPPALEP